MNTILGLGQDVVYKGKTYRIADDLDFCVEADFTRWLKSQAMQSANFRQRLTSTGFVIPATGSKPYTAFVKAELDQWTRVIKAAGIKPE